MLVLKQIDSLIADVSVSNFYNKVEIDDIDNGLPTFILNTCSKHGIDTFPQVSITITLDILMPNLG